MPVSSDEKEKRSQKIHSKMKSIVVAVITATLMIVVGILVYGTVAANATKEKERFEKLSNEEITVPSENSFDLIF